MALYKCSCIIAEKFRMSFVMEKAQKAGFTFHTVLAFSLLKEAAATYGPL